MKDNTRIPKHGIAEFAGHGVKLRSHPRPPSLAARLSFDSYLFSVCWSRKACLGCSQVHIDASAQPSSIELEELFRLGEDEDGVLFGRIAQIASDAAGRIYVADYQNPVVQVFSDAGELESTFGGEGTGPGEFMSIRQRVCWPRWRGLCLGWARHRPRLSAFEERSSGKFEFNGSAQIGEHDGKYPSVFVGMGTEGMVFAYDLGYGFCDGCKESDRWTAIRTMPCW